MGGCTSKDKTVAENEGCVKYIFFPLLFSPLCRFCRQRWHTNVEARESEKESVMNFLLLCWRIFSLTLFKKIFFYHFPTPIFQSFPKTIFVCAKIKFTNALSSSTFSQVHCCHHHGRHHHHYLMISDKFIHYIVQ